MTIVHIVLFGFKPSADDSAIKDVCERMLALRENCIHPTTKKPYILSNSGGKDNSPEGLQGGITHAFVSHFANAEDRKYYIEQDPAHLAFVKSLDGVVEKAQVIDYTIGEF
ncbi:hypothetical protein F5884DRAFT_783547 [Xylogone sp. PMI_703]|nr:hypothetical protein F5884DRAFT_783547 [Xylogone sp. PMI_703]